MYVNTVQGEGYLIGNSRGKIYTNENLIAHFKMAMFKEKYNVKVFSK